MKRTSLLLVLLLSLSLTACGGFQLRGTEEFPSSLSPVMIAGLNPYSDLYRQIQYQLNARNIEVANSQANAASVLKLTNLQARDNLVAIDTRGKGVEYLLIERATVSLVDAGGKTLVAATEVAVDHYRYALGSEQLATDREQQEKRSEMQQELAQKIIRTLHYSLR